MNRINSEDHPEYEGGTKRLYAYSPEDEAIIKKAFSIIERQHQRRQQAGYILGHEDSERFLMTRLCQRKNEHFAVLYLDTRHCVIDYFEEFHGTIDGASIYARVIVQRALELNASACVLAHNHPSGDPSPSRADQTMTIKLKDALKLVDVRVLDHVIIGAGTSISFAKQGLI